MQIALRLHEAQKPTVHMKKCAVALSAAKFEINEKKKKKDKS